MEMSDSASKATRAHGSDRMHVYAFSCGWLASDMAGFVAGAPGRVKVPVPAFLIDHPKGRVLFDTGMHPAAGTDPDTRLGALSPMFDVFFGEDENVASRLAALDVDAARVDRVILSHLHFDHAGGVELLPNARLVVQRREWEAGGDADLAARCGFDRKDYDLGHDVELVDGEHDVFGDGRVVCIPTHGHTPGHQSLRIRMDDGTDVVLCSDACYLKRNLDEMMLPSVVFSKRQMTASLEKLAALRAAGATMVYGHDPENWATVVQAPLDFRVA
ncbi:MAG TPA: N-acyl homoserine lactonase family protein [Candidatus Limnocylindrales bacterium]|nr:N-acyl homoserine lactonase family protein [Candidatus Limnocylindrales bacterium]